LIESWFGVYLRLVYGLFRVGLCWYYITYLKSRRYSATIFVPHLLCVWFSESRFGMNQIEDIMST
jgi:hypothetical protein